MDSLRSVLQHVTRYQFGVYQFLAPLFHNFHVQLLIFEADSLFLFDIQGNYLPLRLIFTSIVEILSHLVSIC